MIAAILALAILLRVLFLGKESLWWDEAASVDIAGTGGWRDLARRLWNGEANMGFYYALLHVWMSLGRSETILRALSVLFAVLTIPVLYLLARRLLGHRTGLLASLLLGLNVFHIQYSQEARSYALLVFLVTLASLLFVSAVQRPSWKPWAAYVGAIVLAIYSHLFAGFVLVAHCISLALRRRDAPWRLFTLAAVAAGILVLPLVVLASRRDYGNWIPHPRPDAMWRLFLYLAGAAPVSPVRARSVWFTASEVARRPLLLLYAGSAGVALAGAWRAWRAGQRSPETWGYAFLLLWLLGPPMLAYAFSLVRPVFVFYYLIISLPPFVVLAANGMSHIKSPVARVVTLLVTVGLALVQASAYYQLPRKEDWRGASAYIMTRSQPGDTLVFDTGSQEAFSYYCCREHAQASTVPLTLPLSSVMRQSPHRVWLVLAHVGDREVATVEANLAIRYSVLDDKQFFNGIWLRLYEARAGSAFVPATSPAAGEFVPDVGIGWQRLGKGRWAWRGTFIGSYPPPAKPTTAHGVWVPRGKGWTQDPRDSRKWTFRGSFNGPNPPSPPGPQTGSFDGFTGGWVTDRKNVAGTTWTWHGTWTGRIPIP